MIKVSQVLEDAALKHLWDGSKEPTEKESRYSCVAIGWAAQNEYLEDKAVNFLYELGMPDTGGFSRVDYFEAGTERVKDIQSQRFTWLLFASQIAREEGN